MAGITRDADVLIVRTGDEYLTLETLDLLQSALTTAENDETVRALVTTGTGKYFSNGLDLAYLQDHPDQARRYLDRVMEVLARILALPVSTAAAVNGHAFGAGAMLSIAHDHSVMRDDRGYWCLPEVDLGLPFEPFMSALVRERLPTLTAHRAMTTGHRFTAPEAVAAGVVHATAPEDLVLDAAVSSARAVSKPDRKALGSIKQDLFRAVLALRPDP